ncbi:hypothetical protein GRJ2_001051200 [Grus japonensis]|uniref:Uncharacterized protein n=1 Tax=Grus japonensis TaxID=30415 RepID=A0ABC9WM28_GRUJA
MLKRPMKGDALLNLTLYKELVRVLKARDYLACSNHEMVEFRIVRGESKTKSRIPNLNLGRADFACSACVNPMECGPGENKTPGELVDFQGTSPPGSRMFCPDKQEIRQRWQEAWMDKQGALDKTQTEKERIQEVEIVLGDPGGL